MPSDTVQTNAALNDASTAAKSNDTETWRKVYQDVVAVGESAEGSGRSEEEDLAGINDRLHAAGLLPGMEIVDVTDDGQLVIVTEDRPGEERTVTEDEFIQEALHPVAKAGYYDGSGNGMAVTTDEDGNISQVNESDGSVFTRNEDGTYSRTLNGVSEGGYHVDLQQDGTVVATSGDGNVTTFNADGTSITRNATGQIVGETKQQVNSDGQTELVQYQFEYGADGTTRVRITVNGEHSDDNDGVVRGAIEEDGSFTYSPNYNDNVQVRETLAGGSILSNDNGDPAVIGRSDGSIANLEFNDDGSVASGYILNRDGDRVGEIGDQPGDVIDRPAADGSITVHHGDNSTSLYKPDGSVVHTDGSGRVTSVDYGNESGTRHFHYNDEGQLTGVTERNGEYFGLNGEGQPKASVSADGSYFIDYGGGKTELRRTNDYTSYTNEVGDIQTTEPEPHTVTDANGNTVTYDESNRVTEVKSKDGSTVSYTYEGAETEPNSMKTEWPDGSTMELTQDEAGNWNVSKDGGEPVAATGVAISEDGTFTFNLMDGSDRNGSNTWIMRPDGSGGVTSEFADGDVQNVQWGSNHEIAQIVNVDGETGSQEVLNVNGDCVEVTLIDADGNKQETKDVAFDPESGTYVYTTSDGQTRVQQKLDGTRVDGVAGPEGTITQVNNVSWREKDGSASSRSYKYDENGELIEATGTGTAANEHWERLEDGSFRKEHDGMVGMVEIEPDGSFKMMYRNSDGDVVAEIQHPDGTVEKRKAEVERGVGFGNATGAEDQRTATVYEDGSMFYMIEEGDTLANIAWDILVNRYGPDHVITDAELLELQEQICRDNMIDDPNQIIAGHSLVIQASVHQREPISLGQATISD